MNRSDRLADKKEAEEEKQEKLSGLVPDRFSSLGEVRRFNYNRYAEDEIYILKIADYYLRTNEKIILTK